MLIDRSGISLFEKDSILQNRCKNDGRQWASNTRQKLEKTRKKKVKARKKYFKSILSPIDVAVRDMKRYIQLTGRNLSHEYACYKIKLRAKLTQSLISAL